jgi:hypothetical protein
MPRSKRVTGHDSAAAVGGPNPTIDEVEDDLNSFLEFLTELEANCCSTIMPYEISAAF